MKSSRLQRLLDDFMRDDARASHYTLAALLVVSVLHAATIA